LKIIKNEKIWMETNAIDQLKKIEMYNGVVDIIGMPDLHSGFTPVGAVIVSENIIYPHLIGNDIACGMNFYKLNIERRKFKQDKITKKLIKFLDTDLGESNRNQNTSNNMPFKDALGTIGSGNHFLEFQEIEKIINPELALKFQIDKKFVYTLVHSGSRGYGHKIFEDVLEIPNIINGFDFGSKEFDFYMESHEKAVKWASSNRDLILRHITEFVGLGDDFIKISENRHNIITQTKENDSNIFVHRKGASEAYFGSPLIISGSRDSFSYLVMPTEKVTEIYNSTAHGAGRKWNRGSAKSRLKNKYSLKSNSTERFKSRFVYKNLDLIFEEAPESYKNINDVIDSLVSAGYVEVIAITKPLVTFKG